MSQNRRGCPGGVEGLGRDEGGGGCRGGMGGAFGGAPDGSLWEAWEVWEAQRVRNYSGRAWERGHSCPPNVVGGPTRTRMSALIRGGSSHGGLNSYKRSEAESGRTPGASGHADPLPKWRGLGIASRREQAPRSPNASRNRRMAIEVPWRRHPCPSRIGWERGELMWGRNPGRRSVPLGSGRTFALGPPSLCYSSQILSAHRGRPAG